MQSQAIAQLDVRSVSAQDFWAECVAARRPAVLTNSLETADFSGLNQWTNDYLCSKVVICHGTPCRTAARQLGSILSEAVSDRYRPWMCDD